MNMQISYQDGNFSFMGFWQENGQGELVSYKRDTVGFVWQNNARNLVPYLTAWQNVQMPMLFEKNVKKKKHKIKLNA